MQASTSRLARTGTLAKGKAPALSTSTTSSTSHRLVAAALLSRPPLLLPPLTPFEKAWHAWNRRLRRAVSLSVPEKLYFRPSSTAQRSYQEREKHLASLPLDVDDGEGEPEATVEEYGDDRPVTDVKRKLARTLYLLLRKDRAEHQWQFPQGEVEEGDETITAAALRELREECGPSLDVWPVGKLPAASFTYTPAGADSSTRDTTVFFAPMRMLRGQVDFDDPSYRASSEGIAEYAWLTREEVRERVGDDLWRAIDPVLSPD